MSTYFENNQFVKYLFNESSEEDSVEFQTEILIDNNKYKEIAEYEGILSMMNELELTPSKKATKNILNFAKKSNLHA